MDDLAGQGNMFDWSSLPQEVGGGLGPCRGSLASVLPANMPVCCVGVAEVYGGVDQRHEGNRGSTTKRGGPAEDLYAGAPPIR